MSNKVNNITLIGQPPKVIMLPLRLIESSSKNICQTWSNHTMVYFWALDLTFTSKMGSLFLTGKWSNSEKTKAYIQYWGLYCIPYYQIVPSSACQKNHFLITKYQLKSIIRHSCSSHNKNRNNSNSRLEKKKQNIHKDDDDHHQILHPS